MYVPLGPKFKIIRYKYNSRSRKYRYKRWHILPVEITKSEILESNITTEFQ